MEQLTENPKAESRWYSKFHPVSESERSLLASFIAAMGELDWSSELGSKRPDPLDLSSWEDKTSVRGLFFWELCKAFIQHNSTINVSIAIRNVRFTPVKDNDLIDLTDIYLPSALLFENCRFDVPLDLSQSHFFSVDVNNCWLPWILAYFTTVDRTFSLEGSQVYFDSPNSAPISLDGAHIGGDLLCTNGVFGFPPEPRTTDSLSRCDDVRVIMTGEHLDVGGSFFLDFCSIRGEVSLIGAKIGGAFDCTDSIFTSCGEISLNLQKVEIDEGLFLGGAKRTFRSAGAVVIGNSIIKNGITSLKADFATKNRTGKYPYAIDIGISQISGATSFEKDVNAEGISITRCKLEIMRMLGATKKQGLNLNGTRLQFYADLNQTWPEKGALHLDGFVYSDIRNGLDETLPINVNERKLWIERDTGSSTEPYVQLANALREQGDGDGATDVLIAMQNRVMHDSVGLKRVGLELLEPLGFGYEPQLSFWSLIATTGVGWIIYRRSYLAGAIVPREKEAHEKFKGDGSVPPNYPCFSPLVYSLENTFPLVNLGQASQWQPDPSRVSHKREEKPSEVNSKSGALQRLIRMIPTPTPRAVRIFLWFQILFGWLLATFFCWSGRVCSALKS